MAALRTKETELYDVALRVLHKAQEVAIKEVPTAQEAMLNLHIDWESLEACLRNRKLDGFEPAILAMQQLSATALAMAAILQSKAMNQRIKQMEQEDRNEIAEILTENKHKLIVKPNGRTTGNTRKKKS